MKTHTQGEGSHMKEAGPGMACLHPQEHQGLHEVPNPGKGNKGHTLQTSGLHSHEIFVADLWCSAAAAAGGNALGSDLMGLVPQAPRSSRDRAGRELPQGHLPK